MPGGVSTCAKPGNRRHECGYGIKKGATLNFNYLYVDGTVSLHAQIKEMAASWEQAGIKLSLESKTFGDVISAAFGAVRAQEGLPLGRSPTGAAAGSTRRTSTRLVRRSSAHGRRLERR